ncbi:hypothetical protein [Saccharothrix sp. Mg75]|uniref:hypothetical protein n=1 Tax=Saccharothrix sp. Mg75 TaxID=3445357 RepID=UPI003EE968E0
MSLSRRVASIAVALVLSLAGVVGPTGTANAEESTMFMVCNDGDYSVQVTFLDPYYISPTVRFGGCFEFPAEHGEHLYLTFFRENSEILLYSPVITMLPSPHKTLVQTGPDFGSHSVTPY